MNEIFGRSILFILTACLCGLLSVSPRGLFTPMPLLQPAVASLLLTAKFFTKYWSDFERSQSSTFREFLAVLSLQAFIDSLRAQTVVCYTDNQNVARIVSIGSKVLALQRMALDIHRLCLLASVSTDMQWIPRDLNIIVNDIRKFVDLNDYGVFFSLDELWGPHTGDRFACYYNAKLPKFNTRIYQPSTSGVNGTREKRSAHACLPCFRRIFAIEIIRDNKTN